MLSIDDISGACTLFGACYRDGQNLNGQIGIDQVYPVNGKIDPSIDNIIHQSQIKLIEIDKKKEMFSWPSPIYIIIIIMML